MSTSVDSLDDHLIMWINNTKICGWRTMDVIDANKKTDCPLPISLLYHGYTTMDIVMAADDDVIIRDLVYYEDGTDDKCVPIRQLRILVKDARLWIKYLRHQNNWDHNRFSDFAATKITYEKYDRFCNNLDYNKIDVAAIKSIPTPDAPLPTAKKKLSNLNDSSILTGTDGETAILFDPSIDGEENKRQSTHQRTHQNISNNEEERNDNANSDIVTNDKRNDNAVSAIVSKKEYKDIDDSIRTSRTHDGIRTSHTHDEPGDDCDAEPDDDCDTHRIV